MQQLPRAAFPDLMALATVLEFTRDHEAHHQGHAWTMARRVGVKPPLFVKIG